MECLCDMTYGFRWFETVSARLSESPGYNSQEYRIDESMSKENLPLLRDSLDICLFRIPDNRPVGVSLCMYLHTINVTSVLTPAHYTPLYYR